MNIKQFFYNLLGWKEPTPSPVRRIPRIFDRVNDKPFMEFCFKHCGPDDDQGAMIRGHYFTWGRGGQIGSKIVLNHRPEEGDIVLLKGRINPELPFEFTEVRHCKDPDDMYFFKAKRLDSLPEEVLRGTKEVFG